MYDLTGRRALVTGSTRGIGRSIAMALAQQGADVCVHGTGPLDEASTIAAQIVALDRKTCAVCSDLTDSDAPRIMLEQASDGLSGPVDLLILNAAIQHRQPLADVDAATARLLFEANMIGSIGLIQGVVPDMQAQGFGRIVTIGSVQQWRPHPQMLVYAAMKSGVENMVRNLAVQLAPHGITVNNVAPGVIETDRNRSALSDPDYRAEVSARIPVGRLGRPDDCAGIIAMLCSAAGEYITGADIPVDGGMRL